MLARELAQLPFKPFDFHGYLANRQVVSFGDRCDYDRRAVVEDFAVSVAFSPSCGIRLSCNISTARRTLSAKFSSINIGPAQESGGTGTAGAVQYGGRRRLAACALLAALSPKEPRHLGPQRRSPGRATLGLSSFRAPPAPRGSTAFRAFDHLSLFNHLANQLVAKDVPSDEKEAT